MKIKHPIYLLIFVLSAWGVFYIIWLLMGQLTEALKWLVPT